MAAKTKRTESALGELQLSKREFALIKARAEAIAREELDDLIEREAETQARLLVKTRKAEIIREIQTVLGTVFPKYLDHVRQRIEKRPENFFSFYYEE